MNRILVTLLLIITGSSVLAAEGFSSLEEQMTGKEFSAAGLDKLSEDELLLYIFTCCATHTLTDFEVTSKEENTRVNSISESDNEENYKRPPNDSELFTFPGDLCAIIRPQVSTCNTSLCLLIASHIWREEGRIGERIV